VKLRCPSTSNFPGQCVYCVRSLLTISAIVLTLRTAAVIGTGELWIFLLQFPLANLCMCVLFRPDRPWSEPSRYPACR
jgi:hypothetical protein